MSELTRPARREDFRDVQQLLEAEGLPVSDLQPTLDGFFVASWEGTLVGVAGVDLFGQVGLFRSLVVEPKYRGTGLASQLTQAVLNKGWRAGLQRVFALTESATGFLEREGFEEVPRAHAPPEIVDTLQFSSLCPESAHFLAIEAPDKVGTAVK